LFWFGGSSKPKELLLPFGSVGVDVGCHFLAGDIGCHSQLVSLGKVPIAALNAECAVAIHLHPNDGIAIPVHADVVSGGGAGVDEE